MKLTVLSEIKAREGFGSEHGLSFLVEVDHKIYLFDTGASDLFKRSAGQLGIDLEDVVRIVLSHGHWDHGNGLEYLKGLPLICHPGCFVKRFRKSDRAYLGLSLSRNEAEARFELETTYQPLMLSEHLWFLGEIPRRNDFEAKHSRYILEDGTDDYIMDDSGLAVITDKGMVIISGCAHSGICNMIEHAMRVTGQSSVHAVIGGFHLRTADNQTRKTIEYLQQLHVDRVLPSHCTFDPALDLFHHAFGNKEVLTGACLEF